MNEQGRDGIAAVGNKQTVGILNDGLARGKNEVIHDRPGHVDALCVVSSVLSSTNIWMLLRNCLGSPPSPETASDREVEPRYPGHSYPPFVDIPQEVLV